MPKQASARARLGAGPTVWEVGEGLEARERHRPTLLPPLPFFLRRFRGARFFLLPLLFSFFFFCTQFLSLSLLSFPLHAHVLPHGRVDGARDGVVQDADVHSHPVDGRDGDALRLGVCLSFFWRFCFWSEREKKSVRESVLFPALYLFSRSLSQAQKNKLTPMGMTESRIGCMKEAEKEGKNENRKEKGERQV